MFLNKTLTNTIGFSLAKTKPFYLKKLKVFTPQETEYLSLTGFFSRSNLDVPSCFTSSRSLYRSNKFDFLKKLSNCVRVYKNRY